MLAPRWYWRLPTMITGIAPLVPKPKRDVQLVKLRSSPSWEVGVELIERSTDFVQAALLLLISLSAERGNGVVAGMVVSPH